AARLPWTVPPALARLARVPWQHPPVVDRQWRLPWQLAPGIAWHVRSPDVEPPPPDPPPPRYIPPPGFAVALSLGCPRVAWPGFAVPIHLGPYACYGVRPRPRRYIVLNSAAVVRLPERTAIAVDAIDIAESTDLFASVQLALAK